VLPGSETAIKPWGLAETARDSLPSHGLLETSRDSQGLHGLPGIPRDFQVFHQKKDPSAAAIFLD
jgi:hypothetical protein